MCDYRALVAGIARDTEIIDRTSFRHATLGTLHPPRDLETDVELPVLRYLWRILYLVYYAADLTAARLFISGGRAVAAIPDHEDYEFVERLRAANPCTGHKSHGWQEVGEIDDGLRVRRHGIALDVPHDRLQRGESSNGRVTVLLPPERRYTLLGWYMVVGDAGPVDRDAPMARLYFTARDAVGAVEVVRRVAAMVNTLREPFQLKVANHPSALSRRDCSVLYVGKQFYDAHMDDLCRLHADLAGHLRHDPPCFARPLAPGISFAEEPDLQGHRMSFGEHRCLLVAEGLLAAFIDGVTSVGGRLDAVVRRFARDGLDLDAPYLNRPVEVFPS